MYSTQVNWLMNQLARKRGANTDEEWQPWLERINEDVEIDSSCAREAAELIFNIGCKGEGGNVLIWGDFDADGITATTIVYEAIRYWSNPFPCNHCIIDEIFIEKYIPHRTLDGHGIKPDVLERECNLERKPYLDEAYRNKDFTFPFEVGTLIVVDTGIEEMEGIKKFLSMIPNDRRRIIVLDHHSTTPERRVPLEWLDAHVFTYDMPDDHPNKHMCAAGLAGLLHIELNKIGVASEEFGMGKAGLPIPFDLMALGTIADMVPMKGINRYIVREGLKAMRTGERLGLSTLIGQTVNKRNLYRGLAVDDIAFNVAPQINSASRIGDVDVAMDLLHEKDEGIIKECTEKLLGYNKQRKEITKQTWESADQQFRSQAGFDKLNACIVYNPEWNYGIVGIVANKFIDKYRKPALVFTDNNGAISGSARSIPSVNLVDLLGECTDVFSDHGGHKGAAGMRVKQDVDMDTVKSFVYKAVAKVQDKNVAQDSPWNPDLIVPLNALSHELLQAQRELEPTGMDNRYPLYETRNLYAFNIKDIPGGHVRFDVGPLNGDVRFSSIWFNTPSGFSLRGPFRILYELREDNYRKQGSLQLVIRQLELQ